MCYIHLLSLKTYSTAELVLATCKVDDVVR
nr:MAG TPA: hypothetical protein [Caudoviricetes sp.]